MKKDTSLTRLPNSPNSHHKPAETYAPSTSSATRSLHPTVIFSRIHSTPFFSPISILNSGSDHTNPSSTKVAAKPNATPRPTCARYQSTSIRSPATVPTATKTLVLFPPPILHSVPQECQTTTTTSPLASRQSRKPLSKNQILIRHFQQLPLTFPDAQT
jgi:hypothetical protein